LYDKKGSNAAKKVLQRIYNQDQEWVTYEFSEIQMASEALHKTKHEFGETQKF
jgi:hypothetical protein